jgi:GxxExxY protein
MTHLPRLYSEHEYPHQRITGAIVVAAHAVHRALGFGFLEVVYKRAVAIELRRTGFTADREFRYDLSYYDESIGYYDADLVVNKSVIVEVKTGLLPDPVAPVQTLNYLRASRLVVGLVLHFGPGLKIKRLVNRPSDVAGGEWSDL